MEEKDNLYRASRALITVLRDVGSLNFEDLANYTLNVERNGVIGEPCYKGRSTGLELSYRIEGKRVLGVIIPQYSSDETIILGFNKLTNVERNYSSIISLLKSISRKNKPIKEKRKKNLEKTLLEVA